jgi:CHRD domain
MKMNAWFFGGSMQRLLQTIFCLTLLTFVSCNKKSASNSTVSNPLGNMVNYTGVFVKSGNQDSTMATGNVMATFNASTLKLQYTITWHNLTSLPVAMHFHDDGPIIVYITGFPVATDQSVSGEATLSSTQATDLANGRIYAMIHTQNYGAGEIMAPLQKQ